MNGVTVKLNGLEEQLVKQLSEARAERDELVVAAQVAAGLGAAALPSGGGASSSVKFVAPPM